MRSNISYYKKPENNYMCNDPYIIILSHVLHSLYQDTKCRSHLIRAVYHLESALTASPSNFHFKLLLVKFYLLLGAGQQAFHFYDHLETKYIQLDSMGYLIATSGYGLGCFSATVALYDTTLKFFFSNTNDSVDHLTYAYKYGSFMKIQEFIEFRDRLNDSLHYSFCGIEKMLHDLFSTSDYAQTEMVMKSMEVKPGSSKISWNNLKDNRDLNVIVSYEPPGRQLNEKTIEKTFENLKSYERLRDAIINSIFAVFDFINYGQNVQNNSCVQNGDSECFKDITVRVVSEMKNLYNDLKSQDLDAGIQDVINTPPPCRLKVFLKLPICQIISDMVDILFISDALKEGDDKKLAQYSESICEAIQTATNSCISKLDSESIQNREMLEELVSVSEMYAATVILCGHLKSFIKRSTKNLRKGKRKKEEEGGNDAVIYKNVLKCVAGCITNLDEALKKISETITVKVVTKEMEALNISESNSDFSNIVKKLKDSYGASVQEIRQFLHEKQFYINTLKS